MQRLKRLFVYSQSAFYLAILICIMVAPASLSANTGLSYFGVHRATVLVYGAGLLTSAYFLLKSLELFQNQRILQLAFRVMALLIAGIVLTPYSLGNWFDWIHTFFGTSLFSIQLLLSAWFLYLRRNDGVSWLLLMSEVAGGLVALIYLAPSQGFLLQGQLVFQLAFTGLLFRNLDRLAERPAPHRAAQ